ncbi:MAG: hypothetical protein WC955_02400 [Elusimicrobiota bacterium]
MRTIVLCLILLLSATNIFAAVGCDLNDPDRDVKRLFPGSTGYKTKYVSIDKKGGNELFKEIEERLGDKFNGIYEKIDVPYTIYEISKGTVTIGYIHGINQKGVYGGIQVFLALDLKSVIKNFYIQKLTAKYASKFRDSSFGGQFINLSLKEFYSYDVSSGTFNIPDSMVIINNPDPQSVKDFKAVLRAVKKNLILMDVFIYSNKHLPLFKKGN